MFLIKPVYEWAHRNRVTIRKWIDNIKLGVQLMVRIITLSFGILAFINFLPSKYIVFVIISLIDFAILYSVTIKEEFENVNKKTL